MINFSLDFSWIRVMT